MSSHSSPSTPPRRKSRRPLPALTVKMQPAQRRAAETFERILDVGARTLADVGIDRLSTNLVCARAGLSPPALYRYFPNKPLPPNRPAGGPGMAGFGSPPPTG